MAITSRVKTTKAKLSKENANDIVKMAAIQMASGPYVSYKGFPVIAIDDVWFIKFLSLLV
jgi:hypothetical protein